MKELRVRQLINMSSKQLVFSLCLSLLIGSYLYLHNSKKVSVEYWIERDKIIIVNSCNSVNHFIDSAIKKEDFGLMLNTNFKPRLQNGKIFSNFGENYIKLKINGFLGDIKDYDQFIIDITQELREVGSKKFVTLYSPMKVHCSGLDFPAFNYLSNFDVINREQRFRYSLIHLCFLAVSPMITIYLFFIAWNYKKYYLDM